MEKNLISKFSKEYESLLTSLKQTKPEIAFDIINDALIVTCIKNSIQQFDESTDKIKQLVVRKLGFNPFFIMDIDSNFEIQTLIENCIIKFDKTFYNFRYEFAAIEHVLSYVLEKHINKKKTGSYYTPEDTTFYMTSNSIVLAYINRLPNNLKDEVFKQFSLNKSTDILNLNIDLNIIYEFMFNQSEHITEFIKYFYKLKIIDPMCGSGAFCMKAFEVLSDISERYDFYDMVKIVKMLHGVDISSEAINLTKVRFILKIIDGNLKFKNFNSIFSKNFICTDAFKGADYKIVDSLGFDWKSFGYRFDCIIGNPPYVEKKATQYSNFDTTKCGNLYALAVERSCNISKSGTIISFIIPLSFVTTQRMYTARKYLEDKANSVYYSMYADRPGCVFKGVHQRLTIFLADIGNLEVCSVYNTNYKFWYNHERAELFNDMSYLVNNSEGLLIKFGNNVDNIIYNKCISQNMKIDDLISKDITKHNLFMSTRIGFWTKAFSFEQTSTEFVKIYSIENKANFLLLLFLNSSLFYFLWILSSDCWHVSKRDFVNFTYDSKKYDLLVESDMKKLITKFEKSLKANRNFINSKQVEFEYKHKLSKAIIDEIDDYISIVFKLTKSECKYIKEYTLKYRMNTTDVEGGN